MTGTVVPFPAARCAAPDPLFPVPRSRVLIDARVLATAIRAGAATAPTDRYWAAIRLAALALLDADDCLPEDVGNEA